MTRNSWLVFCLAYLIGLSVNGLIPFDDQWTGQQWCWLILGLGLLCLVSAIALEKSLKLPRPVWLSAWLIAVLAVVYFQLRLPQPATDDISHQVNSSKGEIVTITGKVIDEPRLNANHRLKFNLQVTQIDNRQSVSGKLYVSLPLLQGTGVNPGENITLSGGLYLPQKPKNPGSFDFQQYLARQGIFAGMHGIEVIRDVRDEPVWGWWQLKRRIVRSHLRGLGSPVGQLVSSMVLGRKAVDLAPDLRDRFMEAGLAHVLAASGFHVSLLLGLILRLTNRLAAQPRLFLGISTLIIYLGLTGIQPSVLRACLMGSAVLFALTNKTKVKPLGLLLLVATLILLFNPLFISDLGFQLSFLATFGLIVTLPGLEGKLDWLPPAIAVLVTVPLAATIWVLPLIAYVFHQVATYSLIVNILCTPLIMVISLGGMISGVVALVFPWGGSAIAWLLLYPTQILISLVNFFTNLPQTAWAVGQIPLGILLSIYSLLLLIWLHPWWRKRWRLGGLLATIALITPMIYAPKLQINFLANQQSQIIVIKDHGEVILINSGVNNQAKYSVIPFLAQQGINHIDYGLALDAAANDLSEWSAINQNATVNHFNSGIKNISSLLTHPTQTIGDEIATKSVRLRFNKQLGVINLQTNNDSSSRLGDRSCGVAVSHRYCTWLILGQLAHTVQKPAIIEYIQQQNLQPQQTIILWSGRQIPHAWLDLLKPQIAIVSSPSIDITLESELNQQQIEFHNTAQEGAIVWTSREQLVSQQNDL